MRWAVLPASCITGVVGTPHIEYTGILFKCIKNSVHCIQMIHEYVAEIYTILGPGFSERVYHNAIEVLLRENGISYETERIIPITFKGHTIGNLRADIIIDKTTVVELKTVKNITDVMVSQARNYLKLLNLQEAYLVNFPPSAGAHSEVIRVTVD